MAAKDADPSINGSTFNERSFEAGTQDWVATCGVCHVGGGQLEYTRDGSDYSDVDDINTAGVNPNPPGDKYIFRYPTLGNENPGITVGYMSATNKAEVDCLMCHLDYTAVGGDGQNGNGRALAQTWGCSSTNKIGPANDKDCNGQTDTGATYGYQNAGRFEPGTAYDMYNRNFALKSEELGLAASMGIGAVGVDSAGNPVGIGPVGLDATLEGIKWIGANGTELTGGPAVIPATAIAGTPKSANCAPCHARDEESVGIKGMYTMKTGFGNYLLAFEAGDVLDTDNGATAANDVAWLDFGCKTGMGKRSHKIGVKDDEYGQNRRYGRSWFFPSTVDSDPATTPNVGDPIVADATGQLTGLVSAWVDPVNGTHLVNPDAQITTRAPYDMAMPDIDVHDRDGMSCATCHYALGSETVQYSIDETTGAITSGAIDIPAKESHHVDYPGETVKSMDHQFAQPDSFPDVKSKNNLDGAVSCESCHLDMNHARLVADGNGGYTLNGTAVPMPTHDAFPALHLDKIACATCHIPETYNAPGRLKYRDWTAGFYKGGFRNMLDWNYDLVTGSHRPSPVVRRWLTKYGETKIYPVLPSVMPIWFEAVTSKGTEVGSTGLDGKCMPDVDPDTHEVLTTSSHCESADATVDGIVCTTDADCASAVADDNLDPWGDGYVTFTDKDGNFITKPQPMKNRDVTKAILMVQNASADDTCTGPQSTDPMAAMMYSGTCADGGDTEEGFFFGYPCNTNTDCQNRFDIRVNGGNSVPLFDGFSLADAWEIDTADEIQAMQGAFAELGLKAKLVLKHTDFDVTHGVVPKEWALGGLNRGGCVSCHSSKAPNVDFATGEVTNPNFSPYSIGFFEGFQQPMEMAGQLVGGYDVVKNWFSLFSSFNCTPMCSGNPMTPEDTYFHSSGTPKWGTACEDNSMMAQMSQMMINPDTGQPYPNNIDTCVGMMTMMFDAAMQFPKGTAMNMGMYDGVAGLAGFVIKEGIPQGHNNCDPFAGPASLSTYQDDLTTPDVDESRNANNCVLNDAAFNGTIQTATACEDFMDETNPYNPGLDTTECNGGLMHGMPCSAVEECLPMCDGGFRHGKIAMAQSDCEGTISTTNSILTADAGGTLIYTRDEVLSHFDIDLQQTDSENPGIAWSLSPTNAGKWDQAQVCIDRDTMPIDYLGFVPGTRPCKDIFPSADMMGMMTGNPTIGATCGSGNPMTGEPGTSGVCDGGKFANGWDPMTQQFGVTTCSDQDGTGQPSADCPWGMNDGVMHISTIIPANDYLGYNALQVATLTSPQTSSYFGELDARFSAGADAAIDLRVNFDATASLCPTYECVAGACNGGVNKDDACVSNAECADAVCSYGWDFGDGNTGSGETTFHDYGAAGTYPATLTVTDTANGYSDSKTLDVAAVEKALPLDPTVTVSPPTVDGVVNLTITNGQNSTVTQAYILWGDYDKTILGSTNAAGTHPHTYAKNGFFNIRVYLFDDMGRRSIQTFEVEVNTL